MSSVTEVAVPTSDFDGNAPVNGSRDMASTFSESLFGDVLPGATSWRVLPLGCWPRCRAWFFWRFCLPRGICFCRDSLWCRWPAAWLVWVAGATVTRAMPGISLSGPFTRR